MFCDATLTTSAWADLEARWSSGDGSTRYATDGEADREEAYALGEQNLLRAWVLTNRDVWHRNPFYAGPPVPHPESDEY